MPTLVGEDFAYYRRYVPSFFFWFGNRIAENDIHELHTPQFYADDSAIAYAAALYAACAAGPECLCPETIGVAAISKIADSSKGFG